jgi:ABC-2 type transport system ATP-binding protein
MTATEWPGGQAAQAPDAGESARPAIAFQAVSLSLGKSAVIHDLSFAIPAGSICGLLAPSGGGKTTVLRLMTGIYAPTTGSIEVLGSAPHRFSPDERRRLGYMPQQFVLYPELSVRRNLDFMAGIYGIGGQQRAARIPVLLEMVDLTDARDRRAGRLSGGMQRRLQLAATLLHEPELLIIDEPTAGIDPLLRARFWDHFRALRNEGRTLVVSTQYVTEAEYCDLVIMLRAGRLVAVGTPDDLRSQALATIPDGNRHALTFEDVFLRLAAADEERSRS